jgi:hypothetical protein
MEAVMENQMETVMGHAASHAPVVITGSSSHRLQRGRAP